MSQKLIMPVNNSTITASFHNPKYYNKFGFVHYGVDIIGDSTIWSCGKGICLLTGISSLYGKYASILYPECYGCTSPFILAQFFHMKDIYCQPGMVLNKDSKVGVMGCSGKYVTGIHLHLEFIPINDLDELLFFEAPEKIEHHLKINPLQFLYVKSSPPDLQSISFTNDGYCNSKDKEKLYDLKRY